jgi:hypothetical protein
MNVEDTILADLLVRCAVAERLILPNIGQRRRPKLWNPLEPPALARGRLFIW